MQQTLTSAAAGGNFPLISPKIRYDHVRWKGAGDISCVGSRRPFALPRFRFLSSKPVPRPPFFGTLEVPKGPEDEGPPNGLTLDQAIDHFVHENLNLRAMFLELPQARADVLTASLRANPILYADAQLVPYGSFSNSKPSGPTRPTTCPGSWGSSSRSPRRWRMPTRAGWCIAT